MRLTQWGYVFAAFAAVVTLPLACGGSDASSAGVKGEERLGLHEVLERSSPPCVSDPSRLVLSSPGEPVECLHLGASAVAVADVVSSWISRGGDGISVGVELNPDGAKRLTDLVTSHIGDPLAIVVNGRVVQLIAPQTATSFSRLGISGLSEDEAVAFVRELGGDTTVPTTTTIDPRVTAVLDRLRAARLCSNEIGGDALGFGGHWMIGCKPNLFVGAVESPATIDEMLRPYDAACKSPPMREFTGDRSYARSGTVWMIGPAARVVLGANVMGWTPSRFCP